MYTDCCHCMEKKRGPSRERCLFMTVTKVSSRSASNPLWKLRHRPSVCCLIASFRPHKEEMQCCVPCIVLFLSYLEQASPMVLTNSTWNDLTTSWEQSCIMHHCPPKRGWFIPARFTSERRRALSLCAFFMRPHFRQPEAWMELWKNARTLWTLINIF